MSIAALQNNSVGPTFQDFVNQALGYDIGKLEAIIRGQERSSMPVLAAMAAYQQKLPQATAAKGQQAQQQLQQARPTVRQEMVQPAIPDMAMLQQQQAGPQPPVLPEQSGVGALPAPNMQGMAMAHGGIIAFDEGGGVPGYAGDDENLVDEYYGLPFGGRSGSEEYWQRPVMPYGEQMRNVGRAVKRGAKKLFSLPDTEVDKEEEEEAQKKKAKGSKEKQYKPYPTDIKKPTAVDPTAGQAVTDANANPFYTPPEKLPPEKKLGAPQAAVPRASGIPAALPTAKPYTAQDALEAQQALTGAGDAEVRGMLDKYKKETATGIEALKAERERTKPGGEAYSKYEESLQKEEAAAKGKEEKNLQMALVNAGLSMMAGTSRYALENIGKGAMVGTKQYMDGIDKLEAAAKKRQEALAMVEQARRAESRDDWKSANDFAAKAFELNQGVQKTQIEAVSKLTGQNKEVAAGLLTQAKRDEAAERRTRIEAESGERRTAMMAGAEMAKAKAMQDQNLFYRQQQSINMAADNAENALKNYAAANKLNLLQMQQQDPNAYNRLREYFRREAFAAAGLEYKPANIANPSYSAEDKALIDKYIIK